MLNYTLKRGFLQWVLPGDRIVTPQELLIYKYHMTVLNYSLLLRKSEGENPAVGSSIRQVLGMIYKYQFPIDGDVISTKLQELHDAAPYVPVPNHGICLNIDIAVGGTVDASDAVMTKFDEWFGNKAAYPVEGKQESQSSDLKKVGYMNNPKKWDANTKFGLKRLELLERLVDEFKHAD